MLILNIQHGLKNSSKVKNVLITKSGQNILTTRETFLILIS